VEPDAGASDSPLAAWERFCDALKRAGAEQLEGAESDDSRDAVDGLRRLAALTVDGLNWYMNCADADFPRFGQVRDTPEIADYWYAPVRAGATYVVRADISTIFDVNVSIFPGDPWGQWTHPTSRPGAPASAIVGDLGRADLDIDADGAFELTISAQRPEGCANWLELPADGGLVVVREYLYDWAGDRPGTYEIVRVGTDDDAPPRMDPATFAARLDGAAAFVRCYHSRAVDMLVSMAPNTIEAPRHASGGNQHIWYAWGSFDLHPDEALLVELDAPSSRAWCIQWLTYPWYANPDLVNRSTSLMGVDMVVADDGKVRVVVGATDPGAPNWLDTGGYGRGVLATRWIWSGEPSAPKTRVVPIGELAGVGRPRSGVSDARSRRAVRRRHFATRRR
jgi:hypothetical protein